MWRPAAIRDKAGPAWRCLLDFLFPRTCVACGRHLAGAATAYACPDCRAGIEWIRDPRCDQCGVPFRGVIAAPRRCSACVAEPPAFSRARSLFLYAGTGARIVHSLKYEHGTWLGEEITLLLRGRPEWADWFDDAALVPVPLHPRKLRARGYNQADIIARAVVAAFPQAVLAPCLRRVRMTTSQTLLRRTERLRNMRGAFEIAGPAPAGRRLMLVDDVLTTGATLGAAAAALQAGGAGEISAFTLAHG